MGLFDFVGDIFGGIIGANEGDKSRDLQANTWENNARLQKEFAQKGIQWRVQDAKKAGIHPLYAIGAQTSSYAPTQIGDTANYSAAEAVRSMGQNIDRAIYATSTKVQRMQEALSTERMQLENDLIRSQIAASNAAISRATNPPMPMLDVPFEREGFQPGHPSAQAGPGSDIAYSHTASGGYSPMKSKSTQEGYEDDFFGNLAWNVRNRLLPSLTFGFGTGNPPYKAPVGTFWAYDPLRQEYKLYDVPFDGFDSTRH